MLQLYKNIKEYRQLRGMTQQELAEAIGYTGGKGMISKIENGKVDLSQSKIKQIAEVLNVPAGDLMGWDQAKIDDVLHFQEELSAREDALEEEIKTRLINMTTGQLELLNGILVFDLTDAEWNDLIDYAKFIVSKRKDI